MSAKDYVERVWRALHETRKSHIDPSEFVVHVARDVWADLKIENPFKVTVFDLDGETRVFGLPMQEDPALEPGSIVLRYEVTA